MATAEMADEEIGALLRQELHLLDGPAGACRSPSTFQERGSHPCSGARGQSAGMRRAHVREHPRLEQAQP